MNLSGILNEPIFESNFENNIDSEHNSKNYENNTDKIPSKMCIPPKKPVKTINLYDKYRDKYANKTKKTEKFSFPSPEKNKQAENKEMNKNSSDKKSLKNKNWFMPQSTRNQTGSEDLNKMYKIFMDNSILLKKMSQRIKKPLSTKMKEDNFSKNNNFNTFCTEMSGLSNVTSPQNVIDNQQILVEAKQNNEIIKNNINNKDEENLNDLNGKYYKSKEKRDVSEIKKERSNNEMLFSYTERKKNNTFHMNENFEKKYSSSRKENNVKKETKIERNKNDVKISRNNQKSEKYPQLSEISSITSKDPAILMKIIEKTLRANNFLVKNVFF